MSLHAFTNLPHARPHPLLNLLSECWWLVMLRGLAGIAFGILTFVWPGLTLWTLILFYGAYVIIDSVTALLAAATGYAKPFSLWWLILVGLSGVAAGLVTIFWPGITALVLIIFIGTWAIAHGLLEIIGAIQLRKEIDNEWMLIIAGALSVIFGLIVVMFPGAGALGLVWAIGSYAIAFGGLLVGFSLRLRKVRALT